VFLLLWRPAVRGVRACAAGWAWRGCRGWRWLGAPVQPSAHLRSCEIERSGRGAGCRRDDDAPRGNRGGRRAQDRPGRRRRGAAEPRCDDSPWPGRTPHVPGSDLARGDPRVALVPGSNRSAIRHA